MNLLLFNRTESKVELLKGIMERSYKMKYTENHGILRAYLESSFSTYNKMILKVALVLTLYLANHIATALLQQKFNLVKSMISIKK